MLKAIVNFLNLKLELLNYFDLTRCLCELKRKGDVVAPKEYVSAGEWQNIDFDSSDGVSYWRLRNPISVTRETNPNKALKRVQTTVPMKLVFSVRRDKLTTDDAYSFDRIRQTIVKQFNIDNGALTTALGAAKVTITAPSSDGDPLSVWEDETGGTGKQEPDFKYVFGSVDIDIVIDSDTDCLPTECDDVDSDILHTFNFCDSAVIDRLTPEQVTCLESTLCGTPDPVTEQINGVTIGTAASGTTNNQVIQNSGGTSVGTAANPSVVGDATVENSDSSYSDTVEAEGSLVVPNTPISANGDLIINQPSTIAKDVVVRYETLGVVPTTITGGEVVVPDALAGATLEIGVYSDAGHTTPITSADFGDTIYIKSTVTGITPTEYRFFVFETASNGVATVQVGNSTSYDISSFNDLVIYAEAKDASVAAAAFTSFEVTINADADATAYINKHNSLSGQVMASAQQDVVQWVYKALKGSGTTFGSDLWTKMVACGAEHYMFTPVSNSAVSLPTIAIDWVDVANTATIVNFIPFDVSNDGVTGGTGKRLTLKNAPSDYPQNDASVWGYSRSALTGANETGIGAGNGAAGISTSTILNISTNIAFMAVNQTSVVVAASTGLGLQIAQRENAASSQYYDNGTLIINQTIASQTPSTNNFYGFAYNQNGTASREFNGKLVGLGAGCSWTANERSDLEEIMDYFAANMNN